MSKEADIIRSKGAFEQGGYDTVFFWAVRSLIFTEKNCQLDFFIPIHWTLKNIKNLDLIFV